MEQLQAKELEILQLKTEMETSQGPEQSLGRLAFYVTTLISSLWKKSLSGVEMFWSRLSEFKKNAETHKGEMR